MTKTEARKKAVATLRRGHYRPGIGAAPIPGTGPLVYAYCPVCAVRISYDGFAWDGVATLQARLRDALVAHMREDH